MRTVRRAPAATDDPPCPRFRLTPRQKEVFALVCEGLSNKHICRRLNIAQPTVKAHVSAILRAVGASNRVEAVLWAIRAEVDYDTAQCRLGLKQTFSPGAASPLLRATSPQPD